MLILKYNRAFLYCKLITAFLKFKFNSPDSRICKWIYMELFTDKSRLKKGMVKERRNGKIQVFFLLSSFSLVSFLTLGFFIAQTYQVLTVKSANTIDGSWKIWTWRNLNKTFSLWKSHFENIANSAIKFQIIWCS